MTDFSVEPRGVEAGGAVLDLAGELDLAAAPAMRAAGIAALGEPGCSLLILDVAKLTFVDSTGIGSWIELRNHAREHDRRVVLQSVPAKIHRVLELAGLTTVFDLAPRSDER